MTEIGKMLAAFGVGLALIGAAIWALGRAGFRGLPGDIHYRGEHLRIDVPIVSCLVLSVVLTGLLWLWQWLRSR